MARVMRPSKAIRHLLTNPGSSDAGQALAALVGTRVFAGKYPPPDRFKNTQAGIVFWRVPGGHSEPGAGLRAPRYVVHCLGGSEDPDDAEAVYDALQWFLHDHGYNTATPYGHIVSNEEVFGLPGFDDLVEEKNWYVVKSFWDFEVGAVNA